MYICVVPAAPFKPEGERVGSNGILLSWRMPPPLDPSIESFVIRYKEMCPHPDPTFTEVTRNLYIPETLLNTLSPGATYNIKVLYSYYFHHLFISDRNLRPGSCKAALWQYLLVKHLLYIKKIGLNWTEQSTITHIRHIQNLQALKLVLID